MNGPLLYFEALKQVVAEEGFELYTTLQFQTWVVHAPGDPEPRLTLSMSGVDSITAIVEKPLGQEIALKPLLNRANRIFKQIEQHSKLP